MKAGNAWHALRASALLALRGYVAGGTQTADLGAQGANHSGAAAGGRCRCGVPPGGQSLWWVSMCWLLESVKPPVMVWQLQRNLAALLYAASSICAL